MLDDDPLARKQIAIALGTIVDCTVREHIAGITQEPPLTARIGQALQAASADGRINVGRHRVRIITQDIPDRGPHALERDIGADLYVGIEVGEGKSRETKGFLVQAKLSRNLRNTADLLDECRDMLQRTRASYVWLYSDKGVRVLKAKQIRDFARTGPEDLPARKASTLFARTLECREGARVLGLPDARDPARMRSAIGIMLEELRAAQGVAISIDRRP
jgi:hypothetical protein